MIGMFCGKNIKNDEEYKKEIIKRMVIFSMVLLLGIITIIIAFAGKYYEKFNLGMDSVWYFMGMGFGLIVGSATVLIKFYILIKNEEKLRKERIRSESTR